VKTVAQVKSILAKVMKKIQDGDMDPHCLGMLERVAVQRMEVISEGAREKEMVPA